MFNPRPAQLQMLRYRRGKMGVMAVPGAGKTATLSALAADLVARSDLQDGQEILVVTLVNSAVNNFSHRIAGFVSARGLMPGLCYRVRTLHGLAHDIVRERPGLVGLETHFEIADERTSREILHDAANAWLNTHQADFPDYLTADGLNNKRVLREDWPDLVIKIGEAFIGTAKDLEASPGQVRQALTETNLSLPLVEMGLEIFTSYQRSLSYRGAVDFSDLISLCLQALRSDEEYLARLRYRWPYILEDEAQDSSELQEKILRKLCGQDGNWVRVGDTNQAIFETFTTASPRFLREFLVEPGVVPVQLPDSGRSQPGVIRLANRLVDWACEEHPELSARSALAPIHIQPTRAGDEQQNPPEDISQIRLVMTKYGSAQEIRDVVSSLTRWLPLNPQKTAAVLVTSNLRGAELVKSLREANLPVVEILQTTHSTRETAAALETVLRCLASPDKSVRAASVYHTWLSLGGSSRASQPAVDAVEKALGACLKLEDYVNPILEKDWLEDLKGGGVRPEILAELAAFQPVLSRWYAATILPVGQLVLTIAQDLFHEPAALATAGKLAAILAAAARDHPEWGLDMFANELKAIATSQRKYAGLADDDPGFNPDDHPGEVIVSTVHKAKGLEFDRVYLVNVNNYDYPSGASGDDYYPEKWFVQNKLNLQAEALHQLKCILAGKKVDLYDTGRATQLARQDAISEKLRLLYVGITRARRELILTWNTGRRGNLTPALALQALNEYWQEVVNATAN